jgi:hypothetical protein
MKNHRILTGKKKQAIRRIFTGGNNEIKCELYKKSTEFSCFEYLALNLGKNNL